MLKVRVVLLLPRGREHRGARRLSAGGRAGRGRPGGRAVVLEEQPRRPAAAPTRCPARAACSCRCAPAADRSASSASTATRRRGTHPPPARPRRAPPARCADRPGGGRRSSGCNLAEDVDRSRLLAETERLRSALLTSISHDLRTPLASILGAASSLENYARCSTMPGGTTCWRTIREEAERLNRFVGNLLDMTRLESGALRAEAGARWTSARWWARRLARARTRARRPPRGDGARRRPAAAAPRSRAVRAGAVQPARQRRQVRARGSTVRLRAWPSRGGRAREVKLQVIDEGPGIPPDALARSLRQVPPRPRRRPPARRHRAGAGDLPRLRRGDGRQHDAPPTGATDPARCSPSPCRCPRHDRTMRADRGRRAGDPPPAAHQPERAGLPDRGGRHRRRGAGGDRPRAAGRRHPGSRPARPRRPRGHPRGAARQPGADRGADLAGVRARQGGGARPRAPTITSPSRSASAS